MNIYTDRLTGDKIFSDNHKINDVNDYIYEVDINEPSENYNNDEYKDLSKDELYSSLYEDYIGEFELSPIPDLGGGYFPLVEEYLEELQKQGYENGEKIGASNIKVMSYISEVLSQNDEFDFLISPSYKSGGMIFPCGIREDGITRYIIIFKHGIVKEVAE